MKNFISGPKNRHYRYYLALYFDQKGQVTIFFGMTLVLLITTLAFVVNVGMFVKARINLQNAVDAAAWSGAAVQARQLSNIAYLNWEMRNVYKEWMFKYYVLGNLANPKTDKNSADYVPAKGMSFKLKKFPGTTDEDLFNLPSTCIHFANTTNICAIYTLPGLPRFGSLGLVGVDETHEKFISAMVTKKAHDCSKRSDINFKAAITWAYGTGNDTLMAGAPHIASHRTGAFPKAIELAIRVRNLEKIVNEFPKTAICVAGANCTNVNSLFPGPNSIPLNERTVKAFYAAYRNLENNDSSPNLKQTFRLTEIPPTPISISENTLGSVLIPTAPVEKYYLDLRLYLVNLVMFYHLFNSENAQLQNVDSEAQCGSTRLALPIPGYPFGLDKNPEVLTYYAVKGEAEYTGLFNPFRDPTPLSAYAAAVPFGGRIGPKLYTIREDSPSVLFARQRPPRTYSYLVGVDVGNQTTFDRNFPIPYIDSFWVKDATKAVGGSPSGGTQLGFGVPNLLYDISTDMRGIQTGGDHVLVVKKGIDNKERAGLYDREQFEGLKSNLNGNAGSITAAQVDLAIKSSVSPTLYESINYLVPTQQDAEPVSTNHIVPSEGFGSTGRTFNYPLFAPLFGPGTFFNTIEDIDIIFNRYKNLNESSIRKYVEALQKVAQKMYEGNTLYLDAAQSIHNFDVDAAGKASNWPYPPSCMCLAGQFYNFYMGQVCNVSGVNQMPLQKNVLDLWKNKRGQSENFQTHYVGEYTPPLNLVAKQFMTAYLPGPAQGASQEGVMEHSFLTLDPTISDRNYYSTKFIAMQSLSSKSDYPFVSVNGFTTYSEGLDKPPEDIAIIKFANQIQTEFLDFRPRDLLE